MPKPSRYALLVAVVVFISLLAVRTRLLVPGVWGVELIAGCRVEIYSPVQQPQWTVVWACPGDDMTWFWPLPVLYPWFEKPLEQPGPGDVFRGSQD